MKNLSGIFLKKPYLAWYVKDVKSVSTESLLEHIFNYGDWKDYLAAEKTLGIHTTKSIFENLKNKPRSNLRTKTVNYFEKYYQRYA